MLNKKVGLIALLVSFAASDLLANTLTNYTVGNVLVCFRKNGGGANDLVVDAGPVSTFTNATPNQRITITQYTGSQLALVGTNSVSWSAFTWYDDTVSPASAQWTLFVTKARTAINTQTAPWQAKSALAQQLPAGDMSTIPPGAVDNLNFKSVNTSTAIVEPDDPNNINPNYQHGQSYVGTLGPNFDFNGDFVGDPENTTPASFTTSGTVVRSDFYQMTPTSGYGVGKFLGYFELSTNGMMTYVAYPTGIPAVPVIKSFSRSGNTTTISFTTGTSGTYTLRGTNSLTSGTARTNWPAIASVGGDGLTHTNTDSTTNSCQFYIITAQ
jgi:hypothetical protein